MAGIAGTRHYSKTRDGVSRSQSTALDATISTPQPTQNQRLSGTPRSDDLSETKQDIASLVLP